MVTVVFNTVFLAALALAPVYVFDSGNPQPSDLVMLVAVGWAVLVALAERRRLDPFILPVPWLALTCWVFLLNVVLMGVYNSSDFLWPSLFWVYNFLAATACVHFLLWNEHGRRLMVMGLVGALLVSGVGVAMDVAGGAGVRVTAFFNNPNQLAYFSLCALGALVILRDFKINTPLSMLAFVAGCVGILAPASLGAMAGGLFIIGALGWANGLVVKRILGIALATVLIVVGVAVVDRQLGGVLERNVLARMDRIDAKVGGMQEERGYDRILEHPEYTLFGAGEALHEERFGPSARNEIHSSFGNLLFSYGIVGLGLFLALLYAVLRRAPFAAWLVMAAPLTYSITHMGLRFTMFWILLAVAHWRYNLCKAPVMMRREPRQAIHNRAPSSRPRAFASQFRPTATRGATRGRP